MKKIFILPTVVIAFSLLTGYQSASAKSPASSSNNNVGHKIILSDHPEETNLNVLYDRAINGITDSTLKEKIPSPTVNIQRISSGNNYISPAKLDVSSTDLKTKTYTTAQVLSTTETDDITTQNVAVTSFVTVQPLASSGSQSDSKTDSSISVRAYSTVHYSVKSIKGPDGIKETSASGGWKILDSSASLSGRTVLLGTSGLSTANGFGTVQKVTHDPSGNTWSYDTPSSWVYVLKGNDYETVGATTTVTIHGHGSSWKLQFTNNL